MRIACLQHVAFEGPGNIAVWAEERGHSLRITHLYGGDALPELDGFDLLVVMGGPMSVNDEAAHAWLAPEKALVRRCLAGGKFVFGVCLGSQLLADVLGSKVYRNRVKEIGWFPVREMGAVNLLPPSMDVFHWHGETYDLPAGCTQLAESDGCRMQAFECEGALGLQFHLECQESGVRNLVHHCADDIGSGPYEQTAEQIVAGVAMHADAMRTALYSVLDTVVPKSLLARFRAWAAKSESPEELQRLMVDAISTDLPQYDWTGFYMLDPEDADMLVLGPFVGEATPHTRIPVTQGICGAAVAGGQTIVVDDVNADPRYLACSLRTKSEIVVPIYVRGKVVGEIDIDSHRAAAFGAADRAFLEEAARIVGSRMERD